MKQLRHQRGFTLVEIAIVLVIIGLLLGGILKGQELIEQSRIKRVINDFNNITAALLTYQDRYGMLPGDDNRAENRWGVTGINGNGDGVVTSFNFSSGTTESNLVWRHLRLAGLVTGDPTSNVPPTTPWQTFYGVGTTTYSVGYQGLGQNVTVFCASHLPAKAAEQLDRQFDDGNPSTGNVRANVSSSATSQPLLTAATSYVDNGNNFYTVCRRL